MPRCPTLFNLRKVHQHVRHTLGNVNKLFQIFPNPTLGNRVMHILRSPKQTHRTRPLNTLNLPPSQLANQTLRCMVLVPTNSHPSLSLLPHFPEYTRRRVTSNLRRSQHSCPVLPASLLMNNHSFFPLLLSLKLQKLQSQRLQNYLSCTHFLLATNSSRLY